MHSRSPGFLCSHVVCLHQMWFPVNSCSAIVYNRASAMLRADGGGVTCLHRNLQ
jgi:hypothetical protein